MAKYDSLKFLNEIFFTVLMIGISSYLATQNIISVGSVLTSYLCFSQLIKPLEELHRILDELSESLILVEDFFEMTEIPNDFSYSLPESRKIEKNITAPHMIDVLDLNFSYDEEAVLSDINISIDKGTFLGIAGPSGCGKSSFIKTVCKLEKAEGKIYIAGKDIDTLSRKEIADVIALVPQNPFLIAGTLYENICYGLKDKPALAEVNEAVKKANLEDFVNSLPEGLDTVIAEHGSNLSGGQKQRIAIARIFLRKPQILILDEATSALDNTSEKLIQNEIGKLKQENQMTILSIAHRLTTLKNCDNIIVINHGKIVQSGRYDELLEKDGIFSDMCYGRLK